MAFNVNMTARDRSLSSTSNFYAGNNTSDTSDTYDTSAINTEVAFPVFKFAVGDDSIADSEEGNPFVLDGYASSFLQR